MATIASENRSKRRHKRTHSRQTRRIASPLGETHQLHVALGLALQAAARLHAVEVTVDVELEQHPRVIRRAGGRERINPPEAERAQLQLLDEDVDHPDGIVLGDEILRTLRKQGGLSLRLACHESLHTRPSISGPVELYRGGCFHTVWVASGLPPEGPSEAFQRADATRTEVPESVRRRPLASARELH
jgi:hypothetical protein